MDKHSSLSQAELQPMCDVQQDVEATMAPQLPDLSTSCDAHAGVACTDDRASSDLKDSSPFSIRGYVAAVREIDITRCWPFSQKLLEESIREGKRPLLPPLTPFGCPVRIQREYYHDGTHTDMDVTCDFNDGPQLQVQINVSKCEPDGQAASKPAEPPDKDESASQEACSPNKKLANKHDSNPFLESAFIFKRQAPARSIREIRKSIMQGCQCFKRMGNAVCTKDTCSNSQNVVSINKGTDAYTSIDDSTVNLIDEMGGTREKHVTNVENVSVITELDFCRKVDDEREGYNIGPQFSHEDRGPNIISRSLEGAMGADVQLIPSCDMLESRDIAKSIPPTSGSGKEFPLRASSKSKTRIECSLDYQNASRAIESQNSKSLNSRPRFDMVMQQETFDSMPGSDNIPQQRCPVCLLFQSSSNTALNAHIDRCLVASSTEPMDKCKLKGKVRKKRSMAELCQVAPPCSELRPTHSTSVPSQKVKESIATECLRRKRTKLQSQGLKNATTATSQSERHKKLIKSQVQALKFLQWRSRSASSNRDMQIPHGATRRSALLEARLANFNKSILRSRKLELNASSTLIKKHWKRQKINHEPEILNHEAHKVKKLMRREKKKCTQELRKDVGRFLTTLPQTNVLKASNVFQSSVRQKDKLVASNSLLPRKRKPSKQTAHVRTSDTVVTVKGSHKTTFEFLRPDDGVNEKLNQPKKVHFRVHVKPGKKQNKQRTTADIPQSLCNTECTTNILVKSLKDTHNQTLLDEIGKALKPAGSAQANLAKEGNSSPDNLRRLAEEDSIAEPRLPGLSSMMQDHRPEVSMPQVTRQLQVVSNENSTTPLLHSHIPPTNDAGRSITEDTTRVFTNINNVPPLSHERQPKGPRNHSSQGWHSLLKETRQAQMKDSQQSKASLFLSSELPHRGGAFQKCREFPFSLCADELSQWPRDSEKANFLMTSSSARTNSCRPAYPFQAEHVARLAQMLGASNRRHEVPARQEISRPHSLMSEAGMHFSIQPETSKATHQLNQGSHTQTNQLATQNAGFQIDSQLEALQAQNVPQRLPAWMQAAIQEQRPSASSVNLPTSPVSQSVMLNTTPHVSREVCRPSPTLDTIGNPVLRLMGKTMVLMPESHQNQVDLTTSHFTGSSNYINFFQSLDPVEVGRKQQWNVNRVKNSDALEGMATQDYRCNNGAHSWINSSTPQIQDFFHRMSPTGNLPVAHQPATPHVVGTNMPAQGGNSQWLHRSSPVPSGILPSTHTDWQHQTVPSTTFCQPRSGLFCQHNKVVPRPPFCEGEIPSSFRSSWKQKHSATYKTLNSVQNFSSLTPQYTKTAKTPPLPSWLSSINRADQPATVIVLDEEGPLCSFETSTPGALGEEVMLGSRSADQQTRQNPWAQTRANISDTCHLRRARHKSKTFIPLIYTVGNNLGNSNGTPRTTVPKFPESTGYYECRSADHHSRVVNDSRQIMSCIDQPGERKRILYTSGGCSPADATRVDANSHSIPGTSKFDCALKHIASVEALRAAAKRMKSLSTRGANSALETRVSRKPSNASQQDDNSVQTTPAVESQTPTMGMCSVNMNPAEVDCQDAGQFMSTPTLIPSLQAMPPHNGGQECADKSSMIHSSPQAQGLSSSQANLTVEKINNASLPAIPPSGPTPESSLRNNHDMVLGSSNTKVPGKEKTNASLTCNFSSACGDLSAMAAINTPSTASNLLPSSRSDDAGTLQECASSRMQPLKVAGKFKIVNGRVSMIRKEMHESMANAAANDREMGRTCTHASTVDVQHNNNSTEVVERAHGHLMIIETQPASE